ncbi:MAG: transporter [Planctomycetes bacterium]|nr:transporter [Planctomycetota bacterium]
MAVSWDDGAGRETGRPEIVQPDQDKEYRRLLFAAEVYHQFSPKLGAGIVLPYADVHLEDNAAGTEGDSSGLGDIRVYGLWSPWEDEEPNEFFDLANLTFIFGLTLPTATDVLPDLPVGRDGQLGGASLDVRLGATYWGNLSESWALFANLNLLLDTGADYTGYRNAPAFSGRVGIGFTPAKQVSMYASFRAMWSGPNHDSTGDVSNTGGTFLHVVPGIVVRPIPQLWFDAQGSFPVFHDVRGDQVLAGMTFTFGVTFTW